MGLFRTFLGETDMLAYLAMMATRLVELRRALKKTGSIYLHCDSAASHYLKILMDSVFGHENFRNEMIWKRTTAHSDGKRAGRIHDVLLFYTASDTYTWNKVYQPYDSEYVTKYYRYSDEDGRKWASGDVAAAGKGPARYFKGVLREPPSGSHWRFSQEKIDEYVAAGRIYFTKNGFPRFKRYLEDMDGLVLQDIWADKDVQPVVSWSNEGLGYPTQKPTALLARIMNASSNKGDVILDPFCGCGTAVEAAKLTGRHWVGIDITIQAMRVIRNERIPKFGADYDVFYRPRDIAAAEAFAEEQPFAFQDWAVERLDGIPSKHRSGDRGIDGRLYFKDDIDGPLRQVLVSVKGGKLKAPFVRELQGAVARERAPMGILLTMSKPSKQMLRDAASSGVYTCSSGMYPKVQIITVENILTNARLDLPPIQRMEESRKRILAVDAATQLPLPGIAS